MHGAQAAVARLDDQRVRWDHRYLACKNLAGLCVRQARLRKSNQVYQRMVCVVVSAAALPDNAKSEFSHEVIDRAAKMLWKFVQVDLYETLRHTRICRALADEGQLARRAAAPAQENAGLSRAGSIGEGKEKDHWKELVRLYLPAEPPHTFRSVLLRHLKERGRDEHEPRLVCAALLPEGDDPAPSVAAAVRHLVALYARNSFAVSGRLKELGLGQDVIAALAAGEFVALSQEEHKLRGQLCRTEPDQVALFGSSSTFRVCVELLFVAFCADRRFGRREELLAGFMRANFLVCNPILQLSAQRVQFATNYARFITGVGLSVRPRGRNDDGVLEDLQRVCSPQEEDPAAADWENFFAAVEAARRVELQEMLAKWNQRMPKTHILRSLEFFARLGADAAAPPRTLEFVTPRLSIASVPRRPAERSPLEDSVRASKLFAARLAAAVHAGTAL